MNENFETADLLMAAFLQVRGHQLLKLCPDGTGQAIFIFACENGIQRDAQEFLEDGLVPVRSLARRVARLRSRCRELRKHSGPMEMKVDKCKSTAE